LQQTHQHTWSMQEWLGQCIKTLRPIKEHTCEATHQPTPHPALKIALLEMGCHPEFSFCAWFIDWMHNTGILLAVLGILQTQTRRSSNKPGRQTAGASLLYYSNLIDAGQLHPRHLPWPFVWQGAMQPAQGRAGQGGSGPLFRHRSWPPCAARTSSTSIGTQQGYFAGRVP
jgi:hypothetical protein